MRRKLLFAFVALAVAAALPVRAQDARTSEVQDAARSWLALTDHLDADGSWAAAGGEFRRALPEKDWARSLDASRKPLGANQQRTLASTRFVQQVPGAPPGDYALVTFRSSFANRDFARERVTLKHTPNKGWRVVGYTIL
jgi:Protein of unknown function (DUF4019)